MGRPNALAAGDKNESTVTLYGSLSQGVKITDRGKKNDGKVDYLNDHLRIGIKATEALGGNTQAFFNLHLTSKETKDGSGLNGLREAYIGLKGDFGKLTLGRQNTAWKSYMGKSVFDDAAIGLARPGKVIRYDLDNIGGSGFKFAIDGILDGSHEVIKNGKNRAFNAYDLAIGYTGGKERIGIWGVNAGYSFDKNNFLSAAYARNNSLAMDKKYKKSYQISYDYKGAKPEDRGSWGAYVSYRYIAGAALGATTDGAMEFTKGVEVGTDYTLFPNVVLTAKYFHGKDLYARFLGLDQDKTSKLFGRVEFFF